MRFIHTADLHIGSTRSIPGFLERQEAVYDQIFMTAIEHSVDAVVIAGDIWHQKTHPPEEKDLFLKKVLQYNRYGFEIIMISGNHDRLGVDRTHLHHLTLQTDLQRLDNVVAADQRIKLHLTHDHIFILMPHGTFDTKNFNEEVRKHVRDIQESSFEIPYKGIVVVAHFAVKGAAGDVALSNGTKQFHMPDGIVIDSNLPVTYIALGDLHISQRVCPGCFYSGSPIQTRWGETPRKGVLLVDTDKPDSPEFLPIESKKLLTFYTPQETWPDDAFIRYITEGEPPDNLPPEARVIIRPSKRAATTSAAKTEEKKQINLLEGLEEHLRSKNCPEDYIQAALAEAKEIAKEQGVDLPSTL